MSGVQGLKREGCIVMLAFLGGIVLTNLLGANQQIHGQLLNQTFLQQYASIPNTNRTAAIINTGVSIYMILKT